MAANDDACALSSAYACKWNPSIRQRIGARKKKTALQRFRLVGACVYRFVMFFAEDIPATTKRRRPIGLDRPDSVDPLRSLNVGLRCH